MARSYSLVGDLMFTVKSSKYIHEGPLGWGVAWNFTSSSEEESTGQGSGKAFPEQASDDELRTAGVGVDTQKNHSSQKPVAGGSKGPAGASRSTGQLLEQDPGP